MASVSWSSRVTYGFTACFLDDTQSCDYHPGTVYLSESHSVSRDGTAIMPYPPSGVRGGLLCTQLSCCMVVSALYPALMLHGWELGNASRAVYGTTRLRPCTADAQVQFQRSSFPARHPVSLSPFLSCHSFTVSIKQMKPKCILKALKEEPSVW